MFYKTCRSFALLTFILLAACDAQALPAKPAAKSVARNQTFQSFWSAFRKATLANDMTAVMALTRFPVVGRGQLDDDREVKISRAAFPAKFRQALGEAGLRQVIRDTPSISAGEMNSAQEHHVDALEFQRTPSGWRLLKIILEND